MKVYKLTVLGWRIVGTAAIFLNESAFFVIVEFLFGRHNKVCILWVWAF